MALRSKEVRMLKKNHFLEFEINQLHEAKTSTGDPQKLDFSTEGWQAVIKARARFYDRFIAKGGNDIEFEQVIRRHYTRMSVNDRDTVFLFLQAEYGRHVAQNKTDYEYAQNSRATRAIRRGLDGYGWTRK